MWNPHCENRSPTKKPSKTMLLSSIADKAAKIQLQVKLVRNLKLFWFLNLKRFGQD